MSHQTHTSGQSPLAADTKEWTDQKVPAAQVLADAVIEIETLLSVVMRLAAFLVRLICGGYKRSPDVGVLSLALLKSLGPSEHVF
jgi:hypothetical protein